MFNWFKKKETSKMEDDDNGWKKVESNTWKKYQWDYNDYKSKDIDDKCNDLLKHIKKTSITKQPTTWTTSNTITINTTPVTSIRADGDLIVKDRNILDELDTLKEALLIVSRDITLEEKYPELKEAYDNYMEMKRSLGIAEKLYNTGK